MLPPQRPFSPGRPGPRPNRPVGPAGQSGPSRGGRPPQRAPRPPRQLPRGLEVVEQGNGLIIFNKPEGLADDTRGPCVLRGASDLLGPKSYPELLTRLERSASGLVVVAEQGRYAAKYRKSLQVNKAPRFFLAVVVGELPSETGTINTRLHIGTRGVVECIPDGEANTISRHAVSHYRVLGSGNGLSLVRVRGETDEEGQVRAHLASIGCPILGDKAFSAERDDLGRPALHLGEISFEPPGKFKAVKLRAPAPAEFWTVCGLDAPANTQPAADSKPVSKDAPAHPDTPDHTESAADDEGWEHVAGWYDKLVAERRSDHHDQIVHPGVLRLLDPKPGERVLDVACGQGELARAMHAFDTTGEPLQVTGVDASPTLIEAATDRSPEGLAFQVADARELPAELGTFDAASCVLALMNIDDLDRALASLAERLTPGGRFVAVVMHPAFRVSKASDWQFDARVQPATQHRRVAAYLSPRADEIIMNPGAVAQGQDAVTTVTHHRPISDYVNACARAGLLVDAMEEWSSERESEPGPRAEAENRARHEIPLFLAIRARKAEGEAQQGTESIESAPDHDPQAE